MASGKSPDVHDGVQRRKAAEKRYSDPRRGNLSHPVEIGNK